MSCKRQTARQIVDLRQGFREKGRAEHRALRVSKGGRREGSGGIRVE